MSTTGTRVAICVLAITALLSSYAGAQDSPTAAKILQDTEAAYQALDTYKAEGTVFSDIEMSGKKRVTETTFSVLLKKPNLYLIAWTRKTAEAPSMDQTSAVWNDGTQPYLYMGMGTHRFYSKVPSDEQALGSATGVSGGAAVTVPSLFLPALKNLPSLTTKLKDAKREADEKIGGEDCYVVSGATATSKKETYWITQSKHLIVKSTRSLDPLEAAAPPPKITDEDIEKAILAMGPDMTEEKKKQVREMMKSAAQTAHTSSLKGSYTETHTKISSPELAPKDFRYALPEGAILREASAAPAPGPATARDAKAPEQPRRSQDQP